MKTYTKTLLSIFMIAGVVGIAAPALAETAVSSSATYLTCMQGAVGAREDSIISGTATFATALNMALVARKDALLKAWAMTDKTARETARIDAWKKFESSVDTAKDAFHKSKDESWNKFRTDRKACGAPVTDTTTQEVNL